jgi:putative nucleotidyltransferase with HDIG domain
MEDISSPRPSIFERISLGWHATRLWLVFAISLIGTMIVVSLPFFPDQSYTILQVGTVPTQDILAPYALEFKSDLLTFQAQEAAADAVPDIYNPPDSQISRSQLETLSSALEFIQTVRSDSFTSQNEKLSDLAAIDSISIEEETGLALLALPNSSWESVRLESLSVLEQVMRSEIREGRLEEAKRTIPTRVSISIPQDQAELVVKLVEPFVVPNALYDETATLASREAARAEIGSISRNYAAGETIIDSGDVVNELHLEALDAYGLLEPPDRWSEIAIRALLITVLGSAFALYGYRAHPEEIQNVRIASTIGVLFILITLAMQFAIPNSTILPLPYLVPAATLPILMAVLISPGMGIMTSVVIGGIAGFIAPNALEIALFYLLSGVFAALMIGKAERLSAFLWAGLAADLAAVAIIVIFRFPDPATDTAGKAILLGTGLASGLFSASVAFVILILVGSIVGITTNLQLIELSRPDHPLLQLLLRNAPGSYQHSLQVANLAEQAARAIGANSLLTRVGSLYHDVGKASRPQFFIENQITGQNVHDQLDPRTSADMILGHVTEGIQLARKHRIPLAISNFISEHHGTMETSYQYRAALEAAGENAEKVDRRDFAYSGPRPRSRETALVMLADGVEAKARADSPKEEEEIDDLVRWVIEDRLNKGQLDRTDLTLKDLSVIRKSFVKTLKSIYHPRIRYPSSPPAVGPPAESLPPLETVRPDGK